jgi:hypothetical protein
MSIARRLGLAAGAGLIAAVCASGVASAESSCTAQFVTAIAPFVQPFGTEVVVPEVRNLTLGGPNLGQEVKVVFATADRSACP